MDGNFDETKRVVDVSCNAICGLPLLLAIEQPHSGGGTQSKNRFREHGDSFCNWPFDGK